MQGEKGVEVYRAKETQISWEEFARVKKIFPESFVDLDSIGRLYPEVLELIRFQGWEKLFSWPDKEYLDSNVKQLYYNMMKDGKWSKHKFKTWISDQYLAITASSLSLALGVPNEGIAFKADNIQRGTFWNFVPKDFLFAHMLWEGETFETPLRATKLKDVPFALHQLITEFLLPTRGHYSDCSYTTLVLTYFLMTRQQVSFPKLMTHHFWRARNQRRMRLFYPRIFTKYMRLHDIHDGPEAPLFNPKGLALDDLCFHTRNKIDKMPDGSYVYLPREEQVKRQKRDPTSTKAKKHRQPSKKKTATQPTATASSSSSLSLHVGESSSSQEPWASRFANIETNVQAIHQRQYTMEAAIHEIRADVSQAQGDVSTLSTNVLDFFTTYEANVVAEAEAAQRRNDAILARLNEQEATIKKNHLSILSEIKNRFSCFGGSSSSPKE